MDGLSALSTGLASSKAATQVGVDVLRSVQNLETTVASELFGSLGLGTAIDTSA